jgi:uncharacterized protein (DUF302 family)
MSLLDSAKALAVVAMLGLLPLRAGATAETVAQPTMFVENVAGKDLDRAVKAFEEEVKAAKWNVLHVHSMDQILATKGYDLRPVRIFEVCSGKYSAKILQNDADRYVSSLIPCRVAIYQRADGEVVISRMNTPMMSRMLTPSVAEVVAASGGDMEAIIERALARVR